MLHFLPPHFIPRSYRYFLYYFIFLVTNSLEKEMEKTSTSIYTHAYRNMERNRETHAHKKKVINDMFITRDDHIAAASKLSLVARITYFVLGGGVVPFLRHPCSSTHPAQLGKAFFFVFFHAPFLVVHHWIRPSLVIAPTCAGGLLFLFCIQRTISFCILRN